MAFTFFSHNGEILPVEQAVVPLNNIEYSYGFGVYETIRVTGGTAHFLEEHCQRLLESATIIELEHPFDKAMIQKSVEELIKKNGVDSCNVKILLIGGATAHIYIQCLNPLFPDRKLYQTGVHTITENCERPFPHAKTLNMLPSYLAYRRAKQQDAYDALLVNRDGCITEGTRTNFFAVKERRLISPPAAEILLGVTRQHLLEVAKKQGIEIVEQPIPLASVSEFDGCFLTSTSSKVLPIRSINDYHWDEVVPTIRELMAAFRV